MLNPELAQIAQDVIAEMREEGVWSEDEIQWSTCGVVLKHCEAQGLLSEGEPSFSEIAGITALVEQVMKE